MEQGPAHFVVLSGDDGCLDGVLDATSEEVCQVLASNLLADKLKTKMTSLHVDVRPLFQSLRLRNIPYVIEPYAYEIIKAAHDAKEDRKKKKNLSLEDELEYDDGIEPEHHAYMYEVRNDNAIRVPLLKSILHVLHSSSGEVREVLVEFACHDVCQVTLNEISSKFPNLRKLTMGTVQNFFGALENPFLHLDHLVWHFGCFDYIDGECGGDNSVVVSVFQNVVCYGCPNLTVLHVDTNDVGHHMAHVLPKLSQYCTQLRELKLICHDDEGDGETCLKMNNMSWNALNSLVHLEVLWLEGLHIPMSAQHLALISKHLRNLKQLQLLTSWPEMHQEVQHYQDQDQDEDAMEPPQKMFKLDDVFVLEHLTDISLCCRHDDGTVPNVVIPMLMQKHPKLQNISLWCNDAEQVVMKCVQIHSKTLNSIVIQGKELSPNALEKMHQCPQLQRWIVFGEIDFSFSGGFQHLTQLCIQPLLSFDLISALSQLPQLSLLCLQLQHEFESNMIQGLAPQKAKTPAQEISQDLRSSLQQCCDLLSKEGTFTKLKAFWLPYVPNSFIQVAKWTLGSLFTDALIRRLVQRKPFRVPVVMGNSNWSRSFTLECLSLQQAPLRPPKQDELDFNVQQYALKVQDPLQSSAAPSTMEEQIVAILNKAGDSPVTLLLCENGFGAACPPMSPELMDATLRYLAEQRKDFLKLLDVRVKDATTLRKLVKHIPNLLRANTSSMNLLVFQLTEACSEVQDLFEDSFVNDLADAIKLLRTKEEMCSISVRPTFHLKNSVLRFASLCEHLKGFHLLTRFQVAMGTIQASELSEDVKRMALRAIIDSEGMVIPGFDVGLGFHLMRASKMMSLPSSVSFSEALLESGLLLNANCYVAALQACSHGLDVPSALKGYQMAVNPALPQQPLPTTVTLPLQLVDDELDVIIRDQDCVGDLKAPEGFQVADVVACAKGTTDHFAVVFEKNPTEKFVAIVFEGKFVSDKRIAVPENAHLSFFWWSEREEERVLIFTHENGVHVARGSSSVEVVKGKGFRQTLLLNGCSDIAIIASTGECYVCSLSDLSKPKAGPFKVGGETSLVASSNTDSCLFFVSSWKSSKIGCIDVSTQKVTDCVADLKRFSMMDGHISSLVVSNKLVVAVMDETIVVLDRMNGFARVGSASLAGSVFRDHRVPLLVDDCKLVLVVLGWRRLFQQKRTEGTSELTIVRFDVCRGKDNAFVRRAEFFFQDSRQRVHYPAAVMSRSGTICIQTMDNAIRFIPESPSVVAHDPFDFQAAARLNKQLDDLEDLLSGKKKVTAAQVLAMVNASESPLWLVPRLIMTCIKHSRAALAQQLCSSFDAIDWNWQDHDFIGSSLVFRFFRSNNPRMQGRVPRRLATTLLGSALVTGNLGLAMEMIRRGAPVQLQHLTLLLVSRSSMTRIVASRDDSKEMESLVVEMTKRIRQPVDFDLADRLVQAFQSWNLGKSAVAIGKLVQRPLSQFSDEQLSVKLLQTVQAALSTPKASMDELEQFLNELKGKSSARAILDGDLLPIASSDIACCIWQSSSQTPVSVCTKEEPGVLDAPTKHRLAILKLLLDAGANINKPVHGILPIDTACSASLLTFLLELPQIDLRKSQLLFRLCGGNHVGCTTDKATHTADFDSALEILSLALNHPHAKEMLQVRSIDSNESLMHVLDHSMSQQYPKYEQFLQNAREKLNQYK